MHSSYLQSNRSVVRDFQSFFFVRRVKRMRLSRITNQFNKFSREAALVQLPFGCNLQSLTKRPSCDSEPRFIHLKIFFQFDLTYLYISTERLLINPINKNAFHYILIHIDYFYFVYLHFDKMIFIFFYFVDFSFIYKQ